MKKGLSLLLAVIMSIGYLSVGAFAAVTPDGGIEIVDSGSGGVLNEDGDYINDAGIAITPGRSGSETEVTANALLLGDTYYFQIDDGIGGYGSSGAGIQTDHLTDADYFTFKLVRDKNSTYLNSVKLVTKRFSGGSRHSYIAVELKDSNVTEEKHVTFDVYFKAKKSVPTSITSSEWSSGDVVQAHFALWTTNSKEEGDDTTVETGKGVVIKPTRNEDNTVTWSSSDMDVASLEFTAASDADEFYAKLSTKIDNTIYEEYGDPVDAELYFRTFSGNSVDSTSRAKLTLYNPWYEDDDDNNVDPRNVYIYSMNDGYLEDITSSFTYVDEDETPSGIDGWQIRTRTLGAYVISDEELPLSGYNGGDEGGDEGNPDDILPPSRPNSNGTEGVPSTGSHDYVALFSALGILSAVTVAVVLKKKSRKYWQVK